LSQEKGSVPSSVWEWQMALVQTFGSPPFEGFSTSPQVQKGSNTVSMMPQASLSVTIWISFQAIKNQSSLICLGEVT
jgi:hypothetical protein